MEFSASLDTTAKVITISVCALFALISVWNARAIKKAKGDSTNVIVRLLIFILLACAVGFSFVYSTKGYETSPRTLTIKNRFNTIILKRNKIMDVRQLTDSEMDGLSKSFGVGGMFGYYGRYHSPSVGDMTIYGTQQKNWVLIHLLDQGAIVLTPDNPKQLVDDVTAIITPNN